MKKHAHRDSRTSFMVRTPQANAITRAALLSGTVQTVTPA